MELLLITVQSLVTIIVLLSCFAGLMLLERKLLGYFQYRLGPNRVGPWGVLQPVADAVKMIVKEDIIPRDADRLVYLLAPIISLFTAVAAFAVVPIAPGWAVADPNAGILVLFAFTALHVYGVTLGGWASQSKYSLLGSLRATAQMISYELAMGMSVVGVLILAGTFRLTGIVEAQQATLWYVVYQPVGFVIFCIAMVAETSRAPFDLPEAETELVSGYNTEYTGMRFAMFVMAEYIAMITASALITLLYLGGWSGPALLPPVVWFLLKVGACLFCFVWLRATVPRLRYDRLMDFGWKVLLPVAFLNLLLTAIWVALSGGPN